MLWAARYTLDCKKRSNSRLAESRRRVGGFPATAFVNWANRCSMAYLSMHSRVVSLFFGPYVLSAVHHWQKWKASSFSPWRFEHKTLPRVSGTCISVLGGLLVTGIPPTRSDSTVPRIGRMERISRSRFRRACRLWCVWCVLGRGGGAGGGRLVRSRRTDVSVVIVYCQSMCSACTDSAVTGRGACTGRLVRMCAACTDSAVTGHDACIGRLVRMCAACTDSAVTWS